MPPANYQCYWKQVIFREACNDGYSQRRVYCVPTHVCSLEAKSPGSLLNNLKSIPRPSRYDFLIKYNLSSSGGANSLSVFDHSATYSPILSSSHLIVIGSSKAAQCCYGIIIGVNGLTIK